MRQTLHRAKDLRKNMTDAEQRLWYFLRNRRLKGFKFKRQVPIGDYIADFLCFDKKLIVELDGDKHGTDSELIYDKKRTIFLHLNGYRVLRYWNHEVFCEIESVLDDIYNHLLV